MLDTNAAVAVQSQPKVVATYAAVHHTTSLVATQADTKLRRTSTANNLAMPVCFTQGVRNKRMVGIMALCPEPLSPVGRGTQPSVAATSVATCSDY